MPCYAILSDIHANLPALRAVVQHAREQTGGDVTFVSLGDVVDYGPQPNECVEWVRAHAVIALQGNHDRVAAESYSRDPMSIDRTLWPITRWTRRVLEPAHKELIRSWPAVFPALGLTLFHSSALSLDRHIDSLAMALPDLRALSTSYGLFGHTHYQGYFSDGLFPSTIGLTCASAVHIGPQRDWLPVPLGEWIALNDLDDRVLLNPGSVGQPRHHGLLTSVGATVDYRAAYMLLQIEDVQNVACQFWRIPYDSATTVKLIQGEMREALLQAADEEEQSEMDALVARIVQAITGSAAEQERSNDPTIQVAAAL